MEGRNNVSGAEKTKAKRATLITQLSSMGSFIFLSKIENTQANGHVLQDEIQTVALSNSTGGTFRLAYMGQTTLPIAYNASAATVDSALEALSTVGTGSVTVSLVSSSYTITFGGGSMHNTNVNSLQADVSTATYGTVDRTLTTTYNSAHEITQQSDPSATIAYTRDNLGRAVSIVNIIAGLTPTVTFDQAFNAGSDRTQVKAKIGSTNDFKTDYTYDTLGRMTDIIQQANGGNAVASKHVSLAYNKLSQFTAFNRYESTGTTNQVASTDFAYDTLNRLTDIDHKQGSTILASYDYAYDFASRITSVNSYQDGLTNYTHDKTDQLTGADHTGQTDETYTFDANGNRSSYTIGTNNLITSDGTNTYQYDDEGNRTRLTVTATGAYTTYTWDYRNRLTAVKDYNSSNVLLKETTYSYDTQNRLIKSTYDADGAGAGVATTRFWAFDQGINPLLEFKGSAASDVSHRYLWGPAVDQLFADEQPTSTGSAGNVLWALSDNLGTIRDIADLSGSTTSVTNHRRFGAFGNLVSESNAAVDMVFAFTGKLYDENMKLQNNLNRWYDAAVGQWTSADPIGFAAGDANIRRYVANSPLWCVDISGFSGKSSKDGVKPDLQKPKNIQPGDIVLKIFVDQSHPGARDTVDRSSNGHVFLHIGVMGKDGVYKTITPGFYPKDVWQVIGSDDKTIPFPGVIKNDTKHLYDVQYFEVIKSPKNPDFEAIEKFAMEYASKSWDLDDRNCGNFAMDMCEFLGSSVDTELGRISHPDSAVPKQVITPNALGEDLMKAFPNNTSRDKPR